MYYLTGLPGWMRGRRGFYPRFYPATYAGFVPAYPVPPTANEINDDRDYEISILK